ncbi:hypothetical protein [Neomoorella thermoacetica]|uniref:hypothetical protein n=1 Tax=Neomoorella thermoacetica TaxID=1525 RepID=UPI0008FB3294|nr:hypothetical protein [Moorella thermoacetica]
MVENGKYRENLQSVQTHLQIIQSVIQRMASNSTSCKAWCITLVSAILVVVADKGKSQYALIAIFPSILFLFLDAYYLALEKMFRESYNSFIEKLYKGTLVASDLYVVSPHGNLVKSVFKSLLSFSIWPFYSTLLVMVWITKVFVM